MGGRFNCLNINMLVAYVPLFLFLSSPICNFITPKCHILLAGLAVLSHKQLQVSTMFVLIPEIGSHLTESRFPTFVVIVVYEWILHDFVCKNNLC